MKYSPDLPFEDKVDLAITYLYEHRNEYDILRFNLVSAHGWSESDALEVHDLLRAKRFVDVNPVRSGPETVSFGEFSVRLSNRGLNVFKNGGYRSFLFRKRRNKQRQKEYEENLRIIAAHQAKKSKVELIFLYLGALAGLISLLIKIFEASKNI